MASSLLHLLPLFRSVPLEAKAAAKAFPLVQLFDPSQDMTGWTRFVRTHTRQHQCGVQGVEDKRGYLNALFVWRVEHHLVWRRTLRVSNVVLGGLPGHALHDAVMGAIRKIAADHDCAAVILETSDQRGGLRYDALMASGFTALPGAAFVQRLGET